MKWILEENKTIQTMLAKRNVNGMNHSKKEEQVFGNGS
jgi:hypothetical protein